MTPTDHPDHPDRSDPGGHGSLTTLAHRGDQRGATTVLAGARHDLRRHQRRRAAAAGTLAVAVLAGAVGAGVLVLRDGGRPVTADSAGGGSPGTGSLVTDIRIDQHDVYDRIVVDFDGPVTPFDPERAGHSLPDTPECRGPADLQQKSIQYWGLVSAAAPTDDGLVAGLSGQRIAGGPYAHEVVPLCAAEGYTWLAIVIDDPEVGSGPGGPVDGVPVDPPDLTGTTGMGKCELADQVLIDVFTWPGSDGTPPSDEICPAPPA